MAQSKGFEDEDVFFASLLEDEGPTALKSEAKVGSISIASDEEGSLDLDGEPEEASIFQNFQNTASSVPPADLDFSAEDLTLRAALIAFYGARNPANLSSINALVKRFRSGGVAGLWAQLATKYGVAPLEAVDLLARTLYLSSIEQADDDVLESLLQRLRVRGRELETAMNEGHLEAVRALCSRGITPELRPRCWKALLGYLPLGGESSAMILEQKRRQHADRFAEYLASTNGELSLKSSDPLHRELLETVKDEVDLTLRRYEPYQTANVKAESLVSIVFLFLAFEDMEYVQGLSDMAFVIAHVLSQDGDYSDADGYWCFASLVSELKARLVNMDRTTAFVHTLVGTGASVLSKYDAQLSEHFGALDFEPGIVVMKWFMLLFSRDASTALGDVVAWWDIFLADPGRFELPGHACVALLLEHREDLLEAGNVLDLVERLQALPREGFSSLARKAWAICLFERQNAKSSPPFPPPSAAKVVRDMAGSFFSGIFTHF